MKNLFRRYTAAILSVAMLITPVNAAVGIYGDADGSGRLTSGDAATIMDYCLDSTGYDFTSEGLELLDVDGNGIIESNDAVCILKKVLWDTPFPVESSETTTQTTTEATTETTTIATQTTTETTTQTTTETTTEATTETTTKNPNSFDTNVGTFYIGQAESALPAADSKGTSTDGVTYYSYNEDYNYYTKVGVQDGKVVSIMTYDTTVSFDGYKIGDSLTDAASDGYYYIVESKYSKAAILELYYDQNDNNRLYAMELVSTSYVSSTDDFSDSAKISELAKQIFDGTNALRVQNGIDELYWNDKLALAAQGHAEDMANNSYFSHQGQDGSSIGTRINAQGLTYSACAENIDAGYYTADTAINGWINSSGHRKNLLSTAYSHLGVGIGYNAGDALGYYTRFVQDFYKPVS